MKGNVMTDPQLNTIDDSSNSILDEVRARTVAITGTIP